MLVDRPDIFKGQRLEVEAVASVVVGRDGLRIAIDHDRLVAVITQRERRMAAAVVKLNSLPDTVGAAAENDDFLLVGRRCLVFVFVGRIQVGREAFELGRASVNSLIDRHHTVLLAQVADLLLPIQPPDCGQPSVRESHALRFAQHLGGNRLHRMLHIREPLRMRRHQPLGQNLRLDLFAAHALAGIERPDPFHQRFLEGAPDGHDFADGFHLGTQRIVGAGEFLELPLRNLHDDIV